MKSKLIYVWLSIFALICVILIPIIGINGAYLKASLILSTYLSLIMTGIIYIARCANNFFRKAEEVNELVNKALTKEDIIDIQKKEFKDLQKLSFHHQTGSKLHEIYSVMKARYELLPNRKI